MFAPSGFRLNFVLALLSLACWGSWGNAAKAAASRPFAIFYLDFTLGVVAAALLGFLSLGGGVLFPPRENVYAPELDCNVALAAAFAAGLVFNVANVLLVLGLVLAGLAVAFPVSIGLALVLGTLLTAQTDPARHPYYLVGGVGLAFVAILCQVRAKALVDARHRSLPERRSLVDPLGREPARRRGLQGYIFCGLSGLLMSCWAPLSSVSMKRGLSPYAALLVFSGAMLVTSPGICYLLMVRPVVGGRTSFAEFVDSDVMQHRWGLIGGAVWAVGTLANLVAGHSIGLALSYAVGQAAPMVATSWGLFYYREFAGAERVTAPWVGLMYATYFAAITCIAGSK